MMRAGDCCLEYKKCPKTRRNDYLGIHSLKWWLEIGKRLFAWGSCYDMLCESL